MSKNNKANIFIHILIWCIVFVLPVIFELRNGNNFVWVNFISFLPLPVAFMIVFYANYSFLTYKFLFREKILFFIIINILLIIALAFALHFWHELEPMIGIHKKPPLDAHKIPVRVFIIRDIFSLSFVAIVSIIIKTTNRLNQMQSKQQELQKAMTEAELKNLKNQLNPHFLLNTLNNIYALSQFNSPKTSDAILDLSQLLRYVLYQNENKEVPLKKEVEFISNYIDLMKLRINDNVKVTTDFDILETSNTMIMPLIYISLIENAFKHGINNNEPSFIQIKLNEKKNGLVEFSCKNSYFPKGESDKSGSGIGISQVIKQLNLIYPNKHEYQTQIDSEGYTTILNIDTN